MPYIAVESDVQGTVSDFGTFCNYIERENPLATKKGDLSTKACFECNQILRNSRKGAKETDRMFQYPSVSLWFSIARESGLIAQEDIKGGKTVFVTTDSYSEFKAMSIFSQYVLIFQTWYCFVDIGEQYMERGMQYILQNLVDGVFRELKENGSLKWYQDKNAKPGDFFSRGKITNYLFEHGYKTAHVLMDLGIIEIKESGQISAHYKSPILSKIKPTPLGHSIMTASEYRRYRWFNVYVEEIVRFDEIETFEQMDEAIEKDKEEFITPFLACFPDGKIDVQAVSKLLFGHEDIESASYTFELKVSLGKKCYRIIHCSPKHTFEELHTAIQEAFSFADDHLYSFYLDGKRYSNNAVNCADSHEPPYAHDVCLGKARLRNRQNILYLFDYGDQWEFDITVRVIDEPNQPAKPKIVKSVGESPEQYPDEW